MMKTLAIVICTFNKKDFVLKCIESVFKSRYTDFDLIVVDNASTDSSVEAIRNQFGNKLTLLVNDENTGGSGGFNRGMQYAIEFGYKYVHLLDNDVEIDPDAIGTLYEFMETRSEVGVCGSLIYVHSDPTLTQEMGAMIDIENFGLKALYSKMREPVLPNEVECDYVAFCSAMIRTEALKKAGTMPVEYFVYWDDMEICWRIRRHGYKVYAISSSKIWHHGTAIEPVQLNTFTTYYYFRNKINCFVRHVDDIQFEALANKITERLYRIIAVNRNCQSLVTTYMHALNDALNGIGGKANSSIIQQYKSNTAVFLDKLPRMKNVIIIFSNNFNILEVLLTKLKYIGYENISVINESQMIDLIVDSDTLAIKTCFHILDVDCYDERFIYLDHYWNSIFEEEFDYYRHYRDGYEDFKFIYNEFTGNKLIELRKKIRITP